MKQTLLKELDSLFQNIFLLTDTIDRVWQERQPTIKSTTPELIRRALEELQPLLIAVIENPLEDPAETSRLGDYGIRLLEELEQFAENLDMPDEAQTMMRLSLPFALIISHLGAKILTPEPVVNAIADLANTQTDPQLLEVLFEKVSTVMGSFDDNLRRSEMLDGYGTPWKILLMNRAIIATRSHRQELIDQAYADIVRFLPKQAKAFFAESAEQMRKIDYPPEVKECVMLWYQRYADKPTLH